MEKRENRRQSTQPWNELYANTRVGKHIFKFPILDISIGGMGVLVTDGFSLLQEGKKVLIETLEKKGTIIATGINGRIAYLGPGVPSRVGIDFAPTDTPIEAYTMLHDENGKKGMIIKDKEEIHRIFNDVKRYSRGFGDMLMISKHKAIPTEFFYLRPADDNMVVRIVRISEFRLPFQPQVGSIYPFYLFKGINVMFFSSKILDVVKNIIEASWPESLQHISRRSVLRYFVTGEEPVTARFIHPLSSEEVVMFVWDISIEGLGVEILNDKIPVIEGMNLPAIRIDLPKGPIETSGIVRSVRNEDVLNKTQLGIEFTSGLMNYRERILEYILEMNFPPETLSDVLKQNM